MTDEGFWEVLRRAVEQPGDARERAEWVAEELTRLPVAQIVEFAGRLGDAVASADTDAMWGAAHVLLADECCEETFSGFRCWLLGLGRAGFHRAVADPDTLTDIPAVRALAAVPGREWPEGDRPDWAEVERAAPLAYTEVTGREWPAPDVLPAAHADAPAPPRLAALFAPGGTRAR